MLPANAIVKKNKKPNQRKYKPEKKETKDKTLPITRTTERDSRNTW